MRDFSEKTQVLSGMKTEAEMMSEEYNDSKNKMLTIRNQEKSLLEQKNRTKTLLDKTRKAIVRHEF